jgi:DNA helicase-2/ATP-dependent DNA helicase PcrA
MFKHLLVDEFQDTNPAHMEVIRLLLNEDGQGTSFWVCGDDWQSIYGFNGASVGNILNFKALFPGSQEFILSENYRSTPEILTACQNLISYNQRKIEKVLTTKNSNGDQVMVLESQSEEDEALLLVNEITDLAERGFEYKDMAVLYRANFQSRVVEESFSQHEIPYYIENGLNFYQRYEIKVLLDYLRLMLNPESDEGDDALRSILNVPNRYITNKFIQELEGFAAAHDQFLYPALKQMPIPLPYLKRNVKDLIAFLDPLMADIENMSPAELIQVLRETLDYDNYISDDDIPSPDDQKIQNLNQLMLSAIRYDHVADFLEYTDSFQESAVSNDKDGVRLMTIHKSKGLEYSVVFVIGMVEGIMPTKKGDIEEERRICFVGISRAMKLLYLSHSLQYLGQPARKSIFIDEIMGVKES